MPGVSKCLTRAENDLRLPFETEVLGVTVTVESIDITRKQSQHV